MCIEPPSFLLIQVFIPFKFLLNDVFFNCSFKLDLANLVNIAAIQAAIEGTEKSAAAQLEFAKDRIIMGTERKTMFISKESKKVCVYDRKTGLAPSTCRLWSI